MKTAAVDLLSCILFVMMHILFLLSDQDGYFTFFIGHQTTSFPWWPMPKWVSGYKLSLWPVGSLRGHKSWRFICSDTVKEALYWQCPLLVQSIHPPVLGVFTSSSEYTRPCSLWVVSEVKGHYRPQEVTQAWSLGQPSGDNHKNYINSCPVVPLGHTPPYPVGVTLNHVNRSPWSLCYRGSQTKCCSVKKGSPCSYMGRVDGSPLSRYSTPNRILWVIHWWRGHHGIWAVPRLLWWQLTINLHDIFVPWDYPSHPLYMLPFYCVYIIIPANHLTMYSFVAHTILKK